jgi:transcription initiation factor TFIIA large subunit
MAASDVKKIYQDVINDVCSAVREALSEEGYDDHTLQELRTLWLARLESSKALEPVSMSIVDQVTNREFRHPTTGDANNSSSSNNRQSTGMKRLHPASNAVITNFSTTYGTSTVNSGVMSVPSASATQFILPGFSTRPSNPTNLGNNTMKASSQVDGANDEVISNKHGKKKSKIIEVSVQLDGTGPPMDDDDDEDDDSEAEGNDVGDELDDDDDDDGNEEGRDDPNPLCSDDDVSEDEPAELFDTENVVVCQYDKISRTKNKWRFTLKSGVMNIEGHDYVFSKATGDADW